MNNDDELKLAIFKGIEVDKQINEKNENIIENNNEKIKEKFDEIKKEKIPAYIKLIQNKNDDNKDENILQRKYVNINTEPFIINDKKREIYSEKKVAFSPTQVKQIYEEIKDKYDYTKIKEKHVIIGRLNYSINTEKRYDKLNIKEIKLYNTDNKIGTYRNLYEYINYTKLSPLLKGLVEKYYENDRFLTIIINMKREKINLKNYFKDFVNDFKEDKSYEYLMDIKKDEKKQKAYNKIILHIIDIKNNLIDKKYELYQELNNNFYLYFSLSLNGIEDSDKATTTTKLITQYGRFYLNSGNQEKHKSFEYINTKTDKDEYVYNNWTAGHLQRVIASGFRFFDYSGLEPYIKIGGKSKTIIDHIIGKIGKNLLKSKNNSINNLRPIHSNINSLNLNQEDKQVNFKTISKNYNNNKNILTIFNEQDLEVKEVPKQIDYKQLYFDLRKECLKLQNKIKKLELNETILNRDYIKFQKYPKKKIPLIPVDNNWER